MSKKHFRKFYKTFLFDGLLKLNPRTTYNIKNPTVASLDYSCLRGLNNTAHFYKKAAFLGLAISQVSFKSYRVVTMKSTIMSLWNSVAAYNFIF